MVLWSFFECFDLIGGHQVVADLFIIHHIKTYVSGPLGRKNRHTLIYIYMEITCYNESNRVDERDLSHMV